MANRRRDGRRPARDADRSGWPDWSPDPDKDMGAPDPLDEAPENDLPAWSNGLPARGRGSGNRRGSPASSTRGSGRQASRSDAPPGKHPLPELSRSLRGSRNRDFDVSRPDASPEETADGWDEPEEWPPDESVESTGAAGALPRHRLAGRANARPRAAFRPAARTRPPRQPPAIAVPPFLANASFVQDRLLLGTLGVLLGSLALLAAVVGNRIGEMPPAVVLHLNAAGVADLWGTRDTLWRLPLAAAMLTVMNVIAGAFLLNLNRFVGRFLVASSVLVNVLAWIAVAMIFW